ncbi:MAG: DinB family protein [Chitinophagales bacterium]
MSKKNQMLVALMAEYKRAVSDYQKVLENVSQAEFVEIKDAATKDPDCHSIQTVSTHIVRSGYGYANYINAAIEKEGWKYEKTVASPTVCIEELNKMLDYNETTFENIYGKTNGELAIYSFKVSWGVTYDLEQLLEHAIVHILRHRRQVEIFLKIS